MKCHCGNCSLCRHRAAANLYYHQHARRILDQQKERKLAGHQTAAQKLALRDPNRGATDERMDREAVAWLRALTTSGE